MSENPPFWRIVIDTLPEDKRVPALEFFNELEQGSPRDTFARLLLLLEAHGRYVENVPQRLEQATQQLPGFITSLNMAVEEGRTVLEAAQRKASTAIAEQLAEELKKTAFAEYEQRVSRLQARLGDNLDQLNILTEKNEDVSRRALKASQMLQTFQWKTIPWLVAAGLLMGVLIGLLLRPYLVAFF